MGTKTAPGRSDREGHPSGQLWDENRQLDSWIHSHTGEKRAELGLVTLMID
jgi:hypothetical protein